MSDEVEEVEEERVCVMESMLPVHPLVTMFDGKKSRGRRAKSKEKERGRGRDNGGMVEVMNCLNLSEPMETRSAAGGGNQGNRGENSSAPPSTEDSECDCCLLC